MSHEKIQILSKLVSNQIAAGEVVERPASVVKELVENSLDANSKKIEVHIREGGMGSILVRDDGVGIAKNELELAIHPHATSKLKSLADLASLGSLGFRGEALASIASVSRFKLQSKMADEQAWQVAAEGSHSEVASLPTAHPQGTSVWVEQLFFNTPVRRKFLRAATTEFYHIDALIKRLALSRPDVRFILKHNDKVVRDLRSVDTEGQSRQLRRIADVLGNPFASNAPFIERDAVGLSLKGWVGSKDLATTSSDKQCFFLNGRWVRDKLISHAIKVALQPYLEEGLFSPYVIFLTCDPASVDVNVHPTKHEVRFRDPRLIHDFIQQSLENLFAEEQEESSKSNTQTKIYQSAETGASYRQEIREPSMGYYQQRAEAPSPVSAISAQDKVLVRAPELSGTQLKGYGVFFEENTIKVVHLKNLFRLWLVNLLQPVAAENEALGSTPLLMPVRIQHNKAFALESYHSFLQQLGFDLSFESEHCLLIKKIPSKLSVLDLPPFYENLIGEIEQTQQVFDFVSFKNFLMPLIAESVDLAYCDSAQWQTWLTALLPDQKQRVMRQVSPSALFTQAPETLA